MVDIRIRKNERCVIGLPACDYVFSSTRSCFIAYGFSTSVLERDILKGILQERGIEAVEAGGLLEPGRFAFCTKICSKIIVAQFCIVIINKDAAGPNANVNMEYGLILGHNKYVIPFQKSDETLPFNVAGLDTIKYDQSSFRRLAIEAIDQAIRETSQNQATPSFGTVLDLFVLINNATVVNLQSSGDERQIFELGGYFGFNLLRKFDGISYVFLGNFAALQGHPIIWRLSKLLEVIDARIKSIPVRVKAGLTADSEGGMKAVHFFLERLEIWLIVPGVTEEFEVGDWLADKPVPFPLQIFTVQTVNEIVSQLPGSAADARVT